MNLNLNKHYNVCGFSIITNIFNRYIDEYFCYRFSGFSSNTNANNINLCIKEAMDVQEITMVPGAVADVDDYIYDDNTVNINIINFNNYLVYDKTNHTLSLLIQERSPMLEKIIAIKIVSTTLSLLLEKRIVCIHGSCVQKGDTGILLLGNSGCGKTSLTLCFLKDGCSMTNDDATFITCNNDSFIATKNTQMIGLTDNSVKNHFKELSNCISFVDDNKKHRVDLSKYHGEFFAEHVKINKIIWIEENRQSNPVISPLKRTRMLKNIITNISANKYLHYDIYIEMISQLVSKCDNYILSPSNNLNQTYKFLNENIEQEMEMKKIYEQIPSTRCVEGCFNCCKNMIQFTPSELKAMGSYEFNGVCSHLVDGKCAVYENRPFVCRLYGASEILKCENCNSERYLSEEETAKLVHEYTELKKKEERQTQGSD